ncbi:MAG: hypothetical protein ACREMY_02565, partial [bacterium]
MAAHDPEQTVRPIPTKEEKVIKELHWSRTAAVRKRGTRYAIASVLVLLLGLAVLSATALGNAPAGKTLEQKCAEDILKQPTVNPPNGVPGTGVYDAGTKRQRFDVGMNFGAVDPACEGHFKRLPYFLPQLVRHGHKIKESPYWQQLFTPGYDPNVGGNFGFSYLTSLTAPKYDYWR